MSKPNPSPLSNPVLLAEIGAAHGVRGELRVKSHTADPRDIAAYGPLFDDSGRRFEVRSARLLKDDMLVVSFAGIGDRNAAETLTRTKLYVDRSVLPEPDEEEFYHSDLLGLAVETVAGEPLGTVVAIPNFGSDDMLEVARPGKASIYLPFTRAVVPTVDLAGRRVIVDPPAETIPTGTEPGAP
jgi:16S rRNA processing protein RimM